MKSYLKMDFYRMLTSKYFGIGILGVVGVYGFSLVQLKSQDVYLLNYYIKFYSTYMLLLIFGAVAYSNAMMEDLEYKNYYLQIQKGSFRKYIWSKVITAFISAVIVMVLGTSIFCLMAHFKMPLLSPDNDMLEYLRFLYNGIIIKHQKTEPTYTKTSLFLCEKRRFFMARREKGVVPIIYFEKERGKSF